MLNNMSMSKKLIKISAATMLGIGVMFGTTSCTLFGNPDISSVNLNLSEEKQLSTLFKNSSIEIAEKGGIYSVVDKSYIMNIAYNNIYFPYDVVYYSDGELINVGSTMNESANSDPLGVLGQTLFEFGVYEFSREDNVYTAKETDGEGVITVTIKNNLVESIYSKDGETIYEVRVAYGMTEEATYFFDKVNKDALAKAPQADTRMPNGEEPSTGMEVDPAEELPTPTE